MSLILKIENSSFRINDLVEFGSSLQSDFDDLKRFAQQFITILGSTFDSKLFQFSITEKISIVLILLMKI